MQEKWRAYLDLTLAMFIAGSAVVVSKMMVGTVPIFLATELGIIIGLIILLAATFLIKKERNHLDLKTYSILLAQAICGIVLYRVFTFWGLFYTSAANSGLISSSSPGIVMILAFFILREKLSFKNFVGLILVLMGLFSINLFTYFSEGTLHQSLAGNFLILIAVICEGLFSVLSKIKCSPMSALYRTTIIVAFACICLLPFALNDALQYNLKEIPVKTVIGIIYYGICVSFLSYVLWFRGIEKVKASDAAIFTSVVPVSSILLSAILLKEKILLIHVIGMILIVMGMLISTVDHKSALIKTDEVEF